MQRRKNSFWGWLGVCGNEWVCLFLCMCLWEGEKQEAGWWWPRNEFCTFHGSRWLLGNRGQNFGLFRVHILLILDLLLPIFMKWFSSEKNSEVFRRWQNCAKGIISTGMVYEKISSVANLFVFCFEEYWIDRLFAIELKGSWLKHPVKSLLLLINQWFIFI